MENSGVYSNGWFLYGTAPLPLPSYGEDRPYGTKMAERSISEVVPSGVLKRASDIWRNTRPGEFFGGSYRAMDPTSWANQQFGLITCVAHGNHMLRAIQKIREPIGLNDRLRELAYDLDSDYVLDTVGYQRLVGRRDAHRTRPSQRVHASSST